MPAASERSQYGGQAVVEGVMMRSPRFFAVSCRRETDGEVITRVENVESSLKTLKWLNFPFGRGTLALIDSLLMGYKALAFSAGVQIQAETENDQSANNDPSSDSNAAAPKTARKLSAEELQLKADAQMPINNIAIGTTTVISLFISFGLFYGLPTLVTQGIQHAHHWNIVSWKHGLELNLVDFLIRISLFLGYIWLISKMGRVARIFQYHGAEHKSINALEAGDDLTVENARKASRIHPRCGTNFIFIVLVVHLFVVALFGRPGPLARVCISIAVLPIVAGIGYEVLKFAGSHRDKKWAMAMIAPGLALQLMTTREPDDSQIEVALASLIAVWDKEHESVAPPASEEIGEPAAVVA